jgi:hypothetical protein
MDLDPVFLCRLQFVWVIPWHILSRHSLWDWLLISPFSRGFTARQGKRFIFGPRIDQDVEQLIIRMARENRSWGYDRIVGALGNLAHNVSDQTVGNVLRRHGLPPAPQRTRTATWAESFGRTSPCYLDTLVHPRTIYRARTTRTLFLAIRGRYSDAF